jgi:hypothetical protein
MVCGEPLIYAEIAGEYSCSFCGSTDHDHIHCPNGHYICEDCHNRDALPLIEHLLFTARSKNPFEIAELAMALPGLPMLGCEHAFIAGGALMSALKNEGSHAVGDEQIREVLMRTRKQAHGGYCGLTGVCGIAPAVGSVFSVLTGAKCGTDEAQHITMEAVIRVSRAIAALSGPSCCKAYVRAALEAGVDYLCERLGIELPRGSRVVCAWVERHPHGCPGESCPSFGPASPQTLPLPHLPSGAGAKRIL